MLKLSSITAGAAAADYAQHKRAHLHAATDCANQGITFVPMVAETSGGWDPAALLVWKALARAEAVRTGQRASVVLDRHLQCLSVAIRRAAALAFAAASAAGADEAD